MKNLKKVNESASRKLNGGAITWLGVAAGVTGTWAVIEAGRGFINIGIGAGMFFHPYRQLELLYYMEENIYEGYLPYRLQTQHFLLVECTNIHSGEA